MVGCLCAYGIQKNKQWKAVRSERAGRFKKKEWDKRIKDLQRLSACVGDIHWMFSGEGRKVEGLKVKKCSLALLSLYPSSLLKLRGCFVILMTFLMMLDH
jgi:hypothetical protein